MKDNVIRNKTFDFALSVIKLYQDLVANKEYVLSKQLLRSGTSIGANVEEASAAISRKMSSRKCLLNLRRQEKQDIGYYYYKKVN